MTGWLWLAAWSFAMVGSMLFGVLWAALALAGRITDEEEKARRRRTDAHGRRAGVV